MKKCLGKWINLANLKKTYFPKISEQAPMSEPKLLLFFCIKTYLMISASKQGKVSSFIYKQKCYYISLKDNQWSNWLKGPFCNPNIQFSWHSSVDRDKISYASKFPVDSEVALVSYARNIASYCCIGHHVGNYDVDIINRQFD